MDHIVLSRIQFGLTTLFHITWPLLSIGLSIFIFTAEILWLRTKKAGWYHQARFWSKIFLLNFAVGVASGIPLEFQFGTNWSGFSTQTGHFLGQMLSIDATLGFMIEAAFLYIMVAGWSRVSPRFHLFSTGMVALGATISSFWIMVANSWMQTPAGGEMVNGVFVLKNMTDAIFNPDMPVGFTHMWLACLATTAFLLCGVSAWFLLRGIKTDFFMRSFKFSIAAALILAPLQAITGDFSGQTVAKHQPAKLAATESHWETNAPGQGAAWSVIAWPDPDNERNIIELRIPYVLSLLATHNPVGKVTGLKDIPREDRPPILPLFYSFRIMVGIGTCMIFLALWAAWAWRSGRLSPARLQTQRPLLWACVLMAPFAYIAVWMGWIMREVGRQPWIVYNMIRTADAATPLSSSSVITSLWIYIALYSVLFVFFLLFVRRILHQGPDTDEIPPTQNRISNTYETETGGIQ
ncbi:cytochrome ubiquinol oxidase subunit I [Desulfovibrio inopinatus]|uniref:cytochrome ubiquinol oxidase subunit I n=1 Tax=Desulfovibrio inopinatus TaxID=102109 RepID=UPI00040C32D4|nr:cytochrome ubiquinol oxidase subunit I [Desulfovibrio inopinatus]